MSKITDDYINNLNKLTSEVLENEPITKTTKVLIETLITTVNFLYEENKDLKVRVIKLENEVQDLKNRLIKIATIAIFRHQQIGTRRNQKIQEIKRKIEKQADNLDIKGQLSK